MTLPRLWAGAALGLATAYLTGAVRSRWLTLLPLLIVLWANSHWAFLVGLVLLALAAAGALAQRAFGVLTPQRLGLLPATLRLASDPSVRGYALEWAPTSLTTVPGMVLGAVSLSTLALLRRYGACHRCGLRRWL
ncbi:MAG: hypothetical protein EXR52_06220 [Dehalococcoidia bacterium]|nr:hypothetical protein [Dehalococcoidia bacterium]